MWKALRAFWRATNAISTVSWLWGIPWAAVPTVIAVWLAWAEHLPPVVIGVLALVGLLLVVLHGVEAAIWAAAYLWLGALGSPTDAVLYSVGAMTTAGSALTLAGHWRMVGALESAGGMLLFGISTAYMFAVMQVYWPMLYPPGHKKT